MRLVFAGTPQAAVPSLQALLESDHEVLAVVTRPPARAGRGRRPVTSPVRALAAEHGLPVLDPARPSEPEFLAALAQLAPDCVPVVAYGALVPPAVLAIPAHGWVNLHFSLLPAWRGAAPVQHAVIAGDAVTGATTFVLERGMDTGPVLGTLTEAVRDTDTAGDLLDRLSVAGAGLLVATLDGLAAGGLQAVPQPTDGVSLAPKLTPDDTRVRWSDPALAIDRLVRGSTPAPGAWTTMDERRLKLGPVRLTDPHGDLPDLGPGRLAVHGDAVLVGTGSRPVQLDQVQPEGKGWMAAAAWARGAHPDGRALA